jgi:transposase InsO family protein
MLINYFSGLQNHFTKFVQLRPLKSKTANEVASLLIDIFSIFGVPAILQSDNGREFRNEIINAFKPMWSSMSIVHDRARHPQSQGSIERANADIKKMLATWMRENNSLKWSIGCKFVQFQKIIVIIPEKMYTL